MNREEYQKQSDELSKVLWNMANSLRGKMDANEFKSYILGVICFKFLSDKTNNYMEDRLKNDNLSYEEAYDKYGEKLEAALIRALGFVLKPEYTFESLMNRIETGVFSIDDLNEAIKSMVGSTLDEDSSEIFSTLFEDMDLNSTKLGKTPKNRTETMADLFKHIDNLRINFDNKEYDILGSAYIELIGLFGMSAGKKGGEFFSPKPACKLCARLATIGLKDVENVADVACGSGSMLLEVGEYVNVRNYYGQELNSSTANLTRMNMLLHGINYKNFFVTNTNTLTSEPYPEIKYTVQVANPPYSTKLKHTKELEQDERFSAYGKLAPSSHAELAFLQHMIYHMADDGRIAILLPHGVLFRGGSEEQIRKYIIDNQNYLDAVIGLPACMFATTGIPVVCLVLKKDRNGDSNNVCFIDASKHFTKQKTINVLMSEDIDRIVNSYTERKDIERYCHIASLDEIRENEYNLNIPRYVDTFIPEEPVDIKYHLNEIKDIDSKLKDNMKVLQSYFDELGL